MITDGEKAEFTQEHAQGITRTELVSVQKREDAIYELRDKLSATLDALLGQYGKSSDSLTEGEMNALDALLGPRVNGSEINVEEQRKALIEYPELKPIIDAVMGDELLTELETQQTQLSDIKAEHVALLEELAQKSLDSFMRKLDYSAILAIEGYDHSINQYRLITQDILRLESLKSDMDRRSEYSPVERYDNAVQTLNFIEDFKERAARQDIPVFLAEERETLSASEIKEAMVVIESVPELIKQIDFHNDLEGFLLSNAFEEQVPLPALLRDVQYALRMTNFEDNPYAAIAIARKIREIQEQLGQLHVRTAWKDALTVDRIYELLETNEDHNAKVAEIESTTVDKILHRYQELLRMRPEARLTSKEIEEDKYFIALLNTIVEEQQPMLPSDERLLRSQLFALHYLFSGHGIDKLYVQCTTALGEGQQPRSPEDERRIKAELAMGFLLQNEKKNREYVFSDNPDATTIGFEYEYTERLEKLRLDYLEDVENYDKASKLIEVIRSAPKGPDREVLLDRFEAYLLELKSEIETKSWILIGDTQANEATVRGVFSHLRETATTTLLMSRIGVFEEDLTYGYREMITQPSNHYRMQQRELIQTLLTGNMRDVNLNMHITVGNVELSPRHPEASDIRAIIESAGFTGRREFTDEEVTAVIDKHEGVTGENFWKCTGFYGTLYYLPYHFVRRGGAMLRYNTDGTPEGYELRSFPKSLGDEAAFSDRVRLISFTDLANKAIKLTQLPEYRQTEQDKALGEAWNTFIGSWKSLLQESGIEYLPLDQRFAKVEVTTNAAGEKELTYLTPDLYTNFMNRLTLESSRNPQFRDQARRLVTAFNHTVKQLTGLKESVPRSGSAELLLPETAA